MRIWAFVPAGGVGSRMASAIPKQYLEICGKPIIGHAVERLGSHPAVAGVVVGVAADDRWFGEIQDLPVKAITRAGESRALTVLDGLSAMLDFADTGDAVMVHDAARPLVRASDIDRLVEVGTTVRDGALLAIPVSDTVKRADAGGRIVETLARERLWRAATPQLFPLAALHGALEAALASGAEVTDEASAMERAGYRPLLVECAADNIKITTPPDLHLAEWLLAQQERGI